MGIGEQEAAGLRWCAKLASVILAPALVVGGGVWTATYALSRAVASEQTAACTPVQVKAPLQNSFDVNVVNAGGTSGAAGAVLKELPLRQFKAGKAANDDSGRRVPGLGQVRYGADGLDQALVVQKLLLPQAQLVNDYRKGTAVDLVLGPDFPGLPPVKGPLVLRTDVVVNVYNTTYYEGLAIKTADGLAEYGFRSGTVGFDPQNAWITDVAAIRYGPDGEAGAKLLAEAVPGATMKLDPAAKGERVDLLIGMQWSGLATPEKISPQSPRPPLAPVDVERPCARR